MLAKEREWMKSNALVIKQPKTRVVVRYVDNRLMLHLRLTNPSLALAPTSLFDPYFYSDPVVLEPGLT